MSLTTSVKSAIRVIEVLEFFAKAQEPCSLKDIIQSLQYPQSSTTILLKNLVGIGYLNYDRQRRKYFPTMRLARLGDWVPAALFGNGRVFDVMNDLHNITGDNIGLGIQNDVFLQYIKNIESGYPVNFSIPEGSMRLLTQSAAGWMLLALQDDKKIDYTVRRANIAVDRPEDRVKVEEFLAQMPSIREQGYAYAENIPFVGAATICVPLPITVQGQPVVMSVGGSIERIQPRKNELLKLLLRSAQSLVCDAAQPDDAASEDAAEEASQVANMADVDGQSVELPVQSKVVRSWFDALGDFDVKGRRLVP